MERVADRYRRLELLGEGGGGQVWLVEDQLRPGVQLALKELTSDSAATADALRREFVLLSRLRHPGLVEVHDLDRSPASGLPRFTLERVEGRSLAAVAAAEPARLPERIAEALRVLAFLHDFGFVHRDLHPANLLVRERPRLGCRVVLLDLGLAARGDDPSAEAAPAGTLAYLAPELFEGAAPGRRSDLYGLGALLFEALAGSPPHRVDPQDLGSFLAALRSSGRPRLLPRPAVAPALAEWIEELLEPDPGLRPAGAREALARLNAACGTALGLDGPDERAARLGSDPLPGRHVEFRRLWSLLEADGGPRLIWLAAPAGCGKSRLLHWAKTEAVLRDWEVALLAGGFARRSEPGAARLLDDLRRHAADGRPTLLLIDEAESGSEALAELLERIAREGRAPALRAVVAVRPGETSHPRLRRLLEQTGTVPTLHRIDLELLDQDGLRGLALRATGTAPTESRLRALFEASEGHPLLAASLLVEDARGRAVVGRSEVLEASVQARLGLLSAIGRSWIEALAVAGPASTPALVARLSGLDDATAHEAAEEVRLAGLAREHAGCWSADSRWVADRVVSAIPSPRRAEIHRAAARLVSASPGAGDAWQLARLWSGAEDPRRAVEAARRAGEEAYAAADPVRAAEAWAFALRHVPRRDSARGALRVAQAEALAAGGLYEAAARAFGAALRSASGTERAGLLGHQALALVRAGRFARARAVAEQVLDLARKPEDALARARALRALGLVLGRQGQEAEAIPVLEQALALLRTAGDRGGEAETLQALAAAEARVERPSAADSYQRAIELCRSLGRHGAELRCRVGLAVLHQRAGRLADARELLERVRREALERGQLDLLEGALSRLASIAIERGELDVALDLGREALDQARYLGDRNRELLDRCRLAEALTACGRAPAAADLLRQGLDDRLDAVEPDVADTARLALAGAGLALSGGADRGAAELLARSSAGFRSRRKVRPLLAALAIEMERSAVDGQDAFEPARLEFEALAREAEPLEPEIATRAGLALARRQLERGDAAAAAATAREALERAEGAGLLTLAALAGGLVARALERTGAQAASREAREQARRHLERAAERIADEDVRRSFLDRRDLRELRESGPSADAASASDRRLVALYDMIRVLNSESDPESLLESILDMALRAVSAERGMILLRDGSGEGFAVRLARNVEAETERDALTFSRDIVARAGEGRSILALDAGRDARFRELRSVSLYGIRSLMCVPLRSRGRIIGTVYLDSRRQGRLFDPQDLRFVEAFADHAALALENARERAELADENRRLRETVETRSGFANLIGRAPAMQKVYRLIETVAESDLPVLIQGESGTGKELVARAIHGHGRRRRRVLLSENCAAIPETLLESELFGHVRGAFTGAERDRRGLFEQADGGTLFLDEIGDMPLSMQARLLRVLQEGELRRVGGERPVRVDVRVLAATNRDLAREVAAGRFREDLYYRLQVLLIQLPPLRERAGDVRLLVEKLLERIGRERGRPTPRLERGVVELLERYAWPGNVRQLENALQRVTLLAGDAPVSLQALAADEALRKLLPQTDEPRFSMDEGVREQLRRALTAAGGNRDRAAKLLGVSRATVYRKIKELGLKDR